MAEQATDRIIVTGGAGYIGAHVAVELLASGRSILIVDNFANSSPIAIDRIREIAGDDVDVRVLALDLADDANREKLIEAAIDFGANGAVHLAGLKAVGESVAAPLRYYETNIRTTFNLVRALEAAGARTLVFSSSATVYGDANQSPVNEAGRLSPTNPYGRTKFFIEEMLRDVASADAHWRICNLRYFNPVGAHPSGRIGEDPKGPPNNLFPYIAQVAVGRREKLSIFGDDYPTPDGTGVRDYIHVVDLARGHVAALQYLLTREEKGALDVNLGAGRGHSVLEAVAAFRRASNRDIPTQIVARRPGDIAEIYADAGRAADLFGWKTEKSLHDMCTDHWRWQRENPSGYVED
ncbi:MAG: UDP-glucose 4-epimerase GalE [Alphaproteobacteria bacterium]|nr:UDP-glucose 4-epimerase GalE [Alphaproteobacteria bacterium]